jgi:hypothetical protein
VLASSLGAGWVYLSNGQLVTRDRFERVRKGMSRDQIESIVGHPPGDYTSGPCLQMPRGLFYWNHVTWLCDEGELLVEFDDNATATSVVICDVVILGPPTMVQRIREWLIY